MGTLISADQLETVTAHVDDAVAKGARVLAGGRARPDLGPYFYEPTILEGVTPDMTCFGNETFGPVVALYRFHDEADAVARANAGEYGLNGSIYSQDGARARAARPPDQVRDGQHQRGVRVHVRLARLRRWAGCGSPAWAGGRAPRASCATPTPSRSPPSAASGSGRRSASPQEQYAKAMTLSLRRAEQAGPGMTASGDRERELRLRRPGHRLRLRGLGDRPAAHREGVPRRRAGGRRPVRRGVVPEDLVGREELPVPARCRLLRHPAHRHGRATA